MPSYPGTVLPMHDHPAWKHLSGTTMDTTVTKEPPVQKKEPTVTSREPRIYVPTGSKTLKRFSEKPTSTNRASYASTTKSQLRQSNQQLFEMLQNIQTELATHRAIMLDVQSRLAFIEQDAPTMVENTTATCLSPTGDLKPPQRSPPPPPESSSSLITPGRESQSWWQACQNFAENCDTPFSAQEFLKTPSRFDDFDFHFGGLTTGEEALAPSQTEIVDTPEIPPESKRLSSENDWPPSPSIFSEGEPRTSGLTVDNYEETDNIIEQIVEFKKPAILPRLLLHPPPSGRTASLLSVEEITALPDLPPVIDSFESSPSHRKSKRSISSTWASLKGKSTETNGYRKGFFSMR